MLFDLEYKITEFLSKIGSFKIPKEVKEIPKDKVVQSLRDIIFSNETSNLLCMSYSELSKAILTVTKCDTKYAKDTISVLDDMGLDLYYEDEEYNLISFAKAKGFLDGEEKDTLEQRIKEHEKEKEKRISAIKKRYVKAYGDDTDTWSPAVRYQMMRELEEF